MKPFRPNRVGALIHQEVAEIIRTEINLKSGQMITVTSVQVSVDSKYADVNVSMIAEEDALDGLLKRLRSNAKRIRFILSDKVHLRRTPELRFKIDETAERAQRIEQILRKSGIDFDEDNSQ